MFLFPISHPETQALVPNLQAVRRVMFPNPAPGREHGSLCNPPQSIHPCLRPSAPCRPCQKRLGHQMHGTLDTSTSLGGDISLDESPGAEPHGMPHR